VTRQAFVAVAWRKLSPVGKWVRPQSNIQIHHARKNAEPKRKRREYPPSWKKARIAANIAEFQFA
jgi:hypothetical protein